MKLSNSNSKILKNLRGSYGFTIMELLVVIGVLGILAGATVSIINKNQPTAIANDSSRRAKMSALIQSLESYRLSEGHYPADLSDSVFKENYVGSISSQDLPGLIYTKPANSDSFTIYSEKAFTPEGGTRKYFVYSSTSGELLECDTTVQDSDTCD